MGITGSVAVATDTRDLDALIEGFEARVAAIIEKYADLAVDLIKQSARVDTGEMSDTAKRVLEAWAAEISIGEGLPDARTVFNEYGTLHIKAQPMVRPAMERIREPFLAELQGIFG